ncbi:MAG: hypothetical protein HQ445_12290 [Polaromonas sp.]|nr:hypothetical protein [Polaromonas sp.]
MSLRWLFLLAALAVTAWFSVGNPDSTDGGVSEAVLRSTPGEASSASRPAVKATATEASLIRLKVRQAPYPLFDAAAVADMAEKEAPIFHPQSWTPPPPKVVAKVELPKAPPWPYVYLGQQLSNGERWVYLTRGEETRAVKKGQILDVTYRVDEIEPPNLSVTYLPLNEVQTVTIGTFK